MHCCVTPFTSGWFKVSDIHSIYYSVSGLQSDDAPAALFVHGGPGSGSPEWAASWFNPSLYKIVLFDQRGAGKSRPIAEVHQNNTQILVEDIELLRKFLKIQKWSIIFGGSWGSLLSLAYLEHVLPAVSVDNVVLYGIFLGRQSEIDSLYLSGPATSLFPDAFLDFMLPIRSLLAYDPNLHPVNAYHQIFTNQNNQYTEEEVNEALRAWTQWELRLSSVDPNWEAVEEKLKANPDYVRCHSIIENHYFLHHCFVPEDKFLRKEFAVKLKESNVNIHLLSGRQDIICPPTSAFELFNTLTKFHVNCKIDFVNASGHTALDERMKSKILTILNSFSPENNITK